MRAESEYAKAGVDYSKIEPFKRAMIKAGAQTLAFPNSRGVFVCDEVLNAHGAVYEFRGSTSHLWCKTQEGLGNLNWIAEWMYMNTGTSYYDVIARAAALIIAIDVISQGAQPVIWTDEVAAGDSDWFANEKRSEDYARGSIDVCRELEMALPAGESPSIRYLVKSEPPVKSCPTLSGSITGIIAPRKNLVTGKNLGVGDRILLARSSGLGANGISLIIRRAMQLKEQFLTRLPNGRTLGEECLIPIISYVKLVEKLLQADVEIHAILPATGDGVGKIAFDKRPFTYRIHSWVEIPHLFLYMRSLGVELLDCLKTFNWGGGLYIFVPPGLVDAAIEVGRLVGRDLIEVGVVEEGERKVIFEPQGDFEHATLPPPGE